MIYPKEDLINLFMRAESLEKEFDYEEYLNILTSILPKNLYRFCMHDNRNLNMIINEQISMSNPNSFNDPYDSYVLNSCIGKTNRKYDIDKIIIGIMQRSDSKIELFKQEMIKENIFSSEFLYEEKFVILRDLAIKHNLLKCLQLNKVYLDTGDDGTNKRLGDLIPQTKIACFSEKKDNVLMWAHYAKSFTGICVEYNTASIMEYVKRGEIFLIPVIYTKHPYIPCKFMQAENTQSVLLNLRQLAYKSEDWNYEVEWRIVKITDNIKQNIIELKGISNIFLGYKFEYFNKYAFHFTDQGAIEQDAKNEQIDMFCKLMDFAKTKRINVVMTRPIEKKYEYEVDESQILII